MIQNYELSDTTIHPGDSVTLVVYADEPIFVQIGCFVDRPPPPRFTGCAECSTHKLISGERLTIVAGEDTWQEGTGEYQFSIRDGTGDTREFSVQVRDRYQSSGPSYQAQTM